MQDSKMKRNFFKGQGNCLMLDVEKKNYVHFTSCMCSK